MGVHRVQEGITRQAIDPASPSGGIMRRSASVAANDIVSGIPGMRRVVDPGLRVVEKIERSGAEFEIEFAKNFEVFQQRSIEVNAAGIVQRITPRIPEGQTTR